MPNYNHPTAGFDKNPQFINLAGRPKKEWTWAGLIEEEVEKLDPADDSLPSEKRAKIKYKVVKKVIDKALAGDISAFTAMANRTDGTPTETKNINAAVVVAPLSAEQQAHLMQLLDGDSEEEKYPDAIEAEPKPEAEEKSIEPEAEPATEEAA